MPEWTAPFHAPRLSTAEFQRKQMDYVAEYGYQYSIPGLSDVVKLPWVEPMSAQEQKWWKQGKFANFSDWRYSDIKEMKEKKKRRYLDMLGSPTPAVFNNRASIMTALDDMQDALSTISAIGIIAVRTLPRTLSRLATGPTGWAMTAADVLNLTMTAVSPERTLMQHKRRQDEATELNPLTKKGRAKTAHRLHAGKIKKGTSLEALQTMDNIFGIGISLGGLMNLPFAIISGAARRAMGQKVTVNYPIPNYSKYVERAAKVNNALCVAYSYPIHTDYEEMAIHLIASNLASQTYQPYWDQWNPLDMVEDVGLVEIEAPRPTDILTIEVIQEIDADGINAIGWPSTDQRWSTIDDLSTTSADTITRNLNKFCNATKRDWMGFEGAINATESALYMTDMLSDPGTVIIDYTAACKTMHAVLNDDHCLPQGLPEHQFRRFENYLLEHESQGTSPTLPETYDFAETICGFSFVQRGAPT